MNSLVNQPRNKIKLQKETGLRLLPVVIADLYVVCTLFIVPYALAITVIQFNPAVHSVIIIMFWMLCGRRRLHQRFFQHSRLLWFVIENETRAADATESCDQVFIWGNVLVESDSH